MEMAEGKRPFDYGMAELVAFASLVKAGTPVRLTGQDSQRGTFNQRHSVLTDIETEAKWIPLEHMAADQARFEVYNTLLSEAAVLGLSMGTAAIIRRRWCFGRRSSATLRTARRS